MTDYTQTEIEAAAFRRLLAHLDERKDVQNIDLMNLAGFCRNCLAKWYGAEAQKRGVELDYDQSRERVYGMSYNIWKEKYQKPASPGQLNQLDRTAGKSIDTSSEKPKKQ